MCADGTNIVLITFQGTMINSLEDDFKLFPDLGLNHSSSPEFQSPRPHLLLFSPKRPWNQSFYHLCRFLRRIWCGGSSEKTTNKTWSRGGWDPFLKRWVSFTANPINGCTLDFGSPRALPHITNTQINQSKWNMSRHRLGVVHGKSSSFGDDLIMILSLTGESVLTLTDLTQRIKAVTQWLVFKMAMTIIVQQWILNNDHPGTGI